MPGRVSQYGSGRFLKSFFGLEAAPTTFYLALLNGLPSDVQDGQTITDLEVSGGSYARQPIASGAGAWELVDSIGLVVNKVAITFPAATADWGKVSHYSLMTAVTAGEIIVSGSLNQDFWVDTGLVCIIGAGLLAFEMTSANEPIIN